MGIPNPPVAVTPSRGPADKDNYPLTNKSTSKTSRSKIKTDDALDASCQSTVFTHTHTTKTVKPQGLQGSFPSGREDESVASTGPNDTFTPRKTKGGVFKRLTKRYHHVLSNLPCSTLLHSRISTRVGRVQQSMRNVSAPREVQARSSAHIFIYSWI
ncbi:hypothetical protein EI94DRAFT_749001 [Lactarius quietus]|nr:hypothetical protein EI94DRAFT_749001 [Lactarius quietus]